MNVLIVDDETNIRLTLKGILEDDGYRCETVGSGARAIPMLESFQPDVMFLDVKMEGMDGFELLEKIKTIDPSVIIIMISGHSGISDAVRAMKLGAFDFLEKPLSLPKVKITAKKAFEFRTMSRDYLRLRSDYAEQYRLIGESEAIRQLRQIIQKVAATSSKVLIRGESGTGKELIAYGIHSGSHRATMPFIKFNSAAIPSELVESELFGFEKGAFTGAHKSKKGKLEEADGGSLFLDEIGDMSLSAQAKILRVMQEGEFERVGSNRIRKIDARIIAATHKNLEQQVSEGQFREDLYYRLNVVPIISPPLREHPEDIPVLIEHFSAIMSQDLKVPRKEFSSEAIKELMTWAFPGNVRELRNLVERIYILSDSSVLKPEDLPVFRMEKRLSEAGDSEFWNETVSFTDKKKDFEYRYLKRQLAIHQNNITQTAKALNLHQSNLSRKLKELGIST